MRARPGCANALVAASSRSVLRREVGDAETMREQIAYLLELGTRPSVALQIVPDTPDVAGALGGAFAIAMEGSADTAVFIDSTVQSGVHTEADVIARAVRVWDGLHANVTSGTRDGTELPRGSNPGSPGGGVPGPPE